MKKLICMALVAIVVAGCSKEEKFDGPDSGSPVEIKLSPGIYGIETKAPVNSGDSITASFVASVTNNDYTVNAWTATARFKALQATSAALSFSPQQYYPINNSAIYIKGFYPAGTQSGKTVTFNGTPGTDDVMITSQLSGTRANTTPLAFVFNHLLTQLQFIFAAGSGFDPTGKTITGVTVKTQQIPTSLDLNTGNVGYTAGNISISGSYAISQAGTLAADHPMMKPGEAVILSVTSSDGFTYPDITIPSLTTEAGKAHAITLTLTRKEITATVSVTDWVTGGTGSSTLQ